MIGPMDLWADISKKAEVFNNQWNMQTDKEFVHADFI